MATQPIRMHIPKKRWVSEVSRDIAATVRRGFPQVDDDTKDMLLKVLDRKAVLEDRMELQNYLEIERAFQRLPIPASKGYDAFVDPTITIDDPTNRTFKTPFAAILYAVDTLGKRNVAIGWINNLLSPTTATETANYSGASTAFVSIEVIGPSGAQYGPATAPPVWDFGVNTDSSKFSVLRIRGIQLNSSATVSACPLGNSTVFADEAVFSGQGSATATAAPALPKGFYRDCTVIDMTLNNGILYWHNVAYQMSTLTSFTWTKKFVGWGCVFSSSTNASTTVTFTGTEFIAGNSTWSADSDWLSVGDATAGHRMKFIFNTSATIRIHISTTTETGNADQALDVNISANIRIVHLSGTFYSLIVAAPEAAGTTVGNVHSIEALVETSFDITGPANVTLKARQGSNFFRGAAITGSATVWGSIASGTALSFVGVTRSVLSYSIQGFGTAGTGIARTVDAGSANNVFIEEAVTTYPGASTNASATTLIITDSGATPSGAAGGSLAGTYPNPSFAGRDSSVDALNKDLLPSLLTDTNGMVTIPTPAPGSAPTGPAGGSLAGTYPNPSFSGRDSSVDKLNQDMLPGWLGGEPLPGVNTIPAPTGGGGAPTGPAGGSLAGTYPNPSFAGRDSSVDKLNQDMLPTLLGPQEGVQLIPAQTPPTGTAGGSLAGTYPNPSFSGRDSSVDKLNQDMLPTLFAPPQGVTQWGINGGPYGSSNTVPVFTLDQYGVVLTAANAAINISESAVIGLVADLAARPTRGQVVALVNGQFIP